MSDQIPKLRLASAESAEDLKRRYERETRLVERQQEDELSGSLKGFRVGSVPYLNAVPLTRGIEDEIVFIPPSQLAEKLRRDELDAALVSISEVLMHDKYDILDGVAVASLGEVKSVFLAHRQPFEEIKEIHCDTASLAGFNLLKVLLAERGLKPTLTPLASYAEASTKENVFLIGDRAIDFLFGNYDHQIFDLGTAWLELTKLPFVYAVWALRRGVKNEELRRQLHSAKVFGMETLDNIINTRPEYTLDFRKDYLGWHIHYHLGTDERRGIAKFVELLRKHGLGPVYDPRFVS
ncbi:MAG: menaquinone biosynthesis protein [Limisphaerales bacterium]